MGYVGYGYGFGFGARELNFPIPTGECCLFLVKALSMTV